jgi:hypothetical protein
MRYPFTLFKVKVKSGSVWHARFWDDALQKYAHSRSTGVSIEGKKERRREAEKAAEAMLVEMTSPAVAVSITPNPEPTGSQIPPNPGSIAPSPATVQKVADMPLTKYLADFWTPDSEYARFKRDVKKKPLTSYYIQMNHDDVRRHIEPFQGFVGVTVGGLSKGMLKKWLIWLLLVHLMGCFASCNDPNTILIMIQKL